MKSDSNGPFKPAGKKRKAAKPKYVIVRHHSTLPNGYKLWQDTLWTGGEHTAPKPLTYGQAKKELRWARKIWPTNSYSLRVSGPRTQRQR